MPELSRSHSINFQETTRVTIKVCLSEQLGKKNPAPIDSLPVKTASHIPSYSLLPQCTHIAPIVAGFWHTSDPLVS